LWKINGGANSVLFFAFENPGQIAHMEKVFIRFAASSLILLINYFPLVAQQGKKAKVHTIAFYNLENLFDTDDDPHSNDNEFLPDSEKKWTPDRYKQKLANLSEVIQQLGDADGPEVLGVCEVENRKVLQDLLLSPGLSTKGYEIIHFDSPDPRGIDVALIYKAAIFKPSETKLFPVNTGDEENEKGSRDILMVGGLWKSKSKVYFFVNHWPSRVGGEEKTAPKRMVASNQLKDAVQSIRTQQPEASFFLMGDFNDDPIDSSLLNLNQAIPAKWQNPSVAVWMPDSIGSLEYRGKWNMFDQILYYRPQKAASSRMKVLKFQVFRPLFLQDKQEKSAGRPYRTYAGRRYQGGYSDHFPVFLHVSF
jgi:hypothetical protein